MLVLHQAEWCPYSSAVRERLTELGIDFVVRQVAPWPEQRTGVESIPTLETDDGLVSGTEEIFDYLVRFEVPAFAAQHRERYAEHREERERGTTAEQLQALAPL
jgi:glutathione S-transferase